MAGVAVVSGVGFLGLSTGLSGVAAANGATPSAVVPDIADIPARTETAPMAVVSARAATCGAGQLTPLAPDAC
jgi:hypothetical protein